jgi:branched-chain amino acid transport system ATP-binding protein
MLKIDNLSVAYGGLAALKGVSIEVRAGEFVSVIGPNGAGKTSLFKAISGQAPVVGGSILFEDKALLDIEPSERPHLGIAHVPEGRQVFRQMTVEENLLLGQEAKADRTAPGTDLESIYAFFPKLAERRRQFAGTLSGGEQQMLAIGRGLASSPRLMMLDEPSMGLAPTIVDQIFEIIHKLHTTGGLTILMVEQRAAEAIEGCDRGYILSSGAVVTEGARTELLANDQVKKAYLGL